jgi:SAM-dependent methyltransferase
MRCAPGTHEAAMKLLRESNISPRPVLDLASGSGALLARLIDAGFADVTAVELDRGKFGLPGVTPLPLDLNGDFAGKIDRKFPLVTAIEIIEHLDSPRHFLQQARELLSDDGVLLLSTPNVAEWVGRIKFLLTGTLRNFDDVQYRHNHHVSPLPDVQLRNLAGEIGLRVIGSATAGTFFGPLKMACLAPIWFPFRLLFGPGVLGDVNLYLLARSAPRPPITGDWTAVT